MSGFFWDMEAVQVVGVPKPPEVPSLKLTGIAPEIGPSQKESSIPTIHFRCELLVLGRVMALKRGY